MRRTLLLHHRMPSLSLCLFVQVLGALVLCCLPIVGQAQDAAPISQSGLNTQVSQPVTLPAGQTQYNITGGTRPDGATGTNLFHSFGDFNVPTKSIANFLNAGSVDLAGNPLAAGLPTSNVLGRVTGVDPSIIFGTIQTNGTGGFGNANLFLMNPNGFLFGPNATLNVGGMVAFTTADYLRLEGSSKNGIFYADTARTSVLSSVPVAAFGFLGSNPAAIAVQGSTLKVAPDLSISLVGGNRGFDYNYIDPDTGDRVSASVPGGITMTGGKLSAAGGRINLASVASLGEVSAVDFMPTSAMTMGNISVSQGALLDVSANAGGTVLIRGGQFALDSATISADTINDDGASTAIDINVTDDMSIANELSPALTAKTTGTGNAGAIKIQSGNLEAITSSSDTLVALIDTHTAGTGTAGSVAITTTGELHATNGAFFIDTGTDGTGHGGDVNVQGTNIQIDGPIIATGNLRFGQLLEHDVSGSGGNLSMKATESLELRGSTISTEAWFAEAGDITLDARNILIQEGSQVALDGDFGEATMRVNADRLILGNAARLTNNTVVDSGGETIIDARVVELTRGSFIQTSTIGDGPAGNIILTATERLTIDDRANPTQLVSGLISSVLADTSGTLGGSGSITVMTPQLELFGGGIINTTTSNNGNAGEISIFANSVTISGQRAAELPGSVLEIGSTRGSGIYTRTVGSDLCVGSCGSAGNITLKTGALILDSGGTINTGTINTGVGGNITLTADQSVTISDGASVSASSTGPGNAGDIVINAGQTFTATNSNDAVTTQADAASGGNITLIATDTVRLTDSRINTSVEDGPGGGGNISIDPQHVILQGSQILAQAADGQGGAITITTNLFLPDAISRVNADSGSGLNGTVTIQSPNSPASGQIHPLGNQPLEATSLLNQRCAALADGEFSSFTVAGRDTLPTEPGSWLASPLAMLSTNSEHRVRSDGERSIARSENSLLSLRQISPAGFLTQAFAGDWSSGCQS